MYCDAMSVNLRSPFLGDPFTSSFREGNKGFHVHLGRRKLLKRNTQPHACDKHNNIWVSRAIRFYRLCGKNVELLGTNIRSRIGPKLNCAKEPFARSRVLVNSLSPLWKEGLIIVRGSVFLAVISGVCLLVWYGQNKAKGYIETKLLPDVCAMISEYIQREVDFGRVRRITPLSITLESSSIGPHSGEFSCGEVPTMKLRVRPFSSLRRGKIVVDAVLSHPTLLVAQKKDYTWLGLPFAEGGIQRHLSSEEGIDYRTKTRRIAREEAAADWERERDLAAKNSAEMGYFVSEKSSGHIEEDDVSKQQESRSTEFTGFGSILCMDEKMHWRDHHCMDTGVDYDMKHADLEKAFGVKIPGSGLKFWSRAIKGPKKFMRKSNGTEMSAAGFGAKRRLLERSAQAAVVYFQRPSQGESDEPLPSPEVYGVTELDSLLVSKNRAKSSDASSYQDQLMTNAENENQQGDPIVQPLPVKKIVDAHMSGFGYILDPFLMRIGKTDGVRKFQENSNSIDGGVGNSEAKMNNEDAEVDTIRNHVEDDASRSIKLPAFQGQLFVKLEPWLLMHRSFPGWLSSFRISLPTLSKSLAELLSYIFLRPIQKLNSTMGPKVEDFVAEIVDSEDLVQTEGFVKNLPVILDSVYFRSGTLMLLGYGDREPR